MMFTPQNYNCLLRATVGSSDERKPGSKQTNVSVLGSQCYSCYTAESLKAVVVMEPNLLPIFCGENINLRCDIQGEPNNGQWWYRWYRGDSLLEDTGKSVISLNQTDYPLYDSVYKCTAQSPEVYFESEPFKMVVMALPTPKITIDAPSPVFPGEKVTFKCEVKSSNEWKYKWFKNHHLEPVATSNTSTTFKHVVETDAGTYWCQGEKRDRPTSSRASKEAHLHMIPLPKANLTTEPQSPLSNGGIVTLKCVIESHNNWTYKWYKDNEENVVIEGNNFTITRATDSDEGTYWCQGVRGERPTSSQLSNSVYVDKKANSSNQLAVGIALGTGISFLFILVVVLHRFIKHRVLCLRQSDLAQPQQTIYQNVGQAQSQPGGSEGDQSLYVPLQRVTEDVYETVTVRDRYGKASLPS
ncbi:low affinity immunoglobulin gamma Fc region receptor II-like isoform X2 [Alosa sapidissima]|uniref:low affinity immunoglobulin gamma Fc region receptor II-like isoform X2 n=1 Tax=Alosa sapidissima TaxID=34773 RepID=UPI001C09A87F|nr:low affinity immunoglobulin gamma Fc region receptor II-like isoform X2 [Alosa sapidissima]